MSGNELFNGTNGFIWGIVFGKFRDFVNFSRFACSYEGTELSVSKALHVPRQYICPGNCVA